MSFRPEFLQDDRGGWQVNYECPWCGTACLAPVAGDGPGRANSRWFVVICRATSCQRGALVHATAHERPSGDLRYTEIVLRAEQCFPGRQPNYRPPEVPTRIAKDFEEALRCRALNLNFAAALVARRALQAAVRHDVGGEKSNLAGEINASSLPDEHKEFAHHVRLVGNRAAHCEDVTGEDLEDLFTFTETVLELLFIRRAQLQRAKARREGKQAKTSGES